MHETDAMQFIETVFIGFLDRHFDYKESQEPKLIEPRLKRIQAFIQDAEPYWVKEKALQIIFHIELADSSIRNGKYVPTTPDTCLTAILDMSKERIEDLVEHFRLEQNTGKMSIPVNLPSFPRKK